MSPPLLGLASEAARQQVIAARLRNVGLIILDVPHDGRLCAGQRRRGRFKKLGHSVVNGAVRLNNPVPLLCFLADIAESIPRRAHLGNERENGIRPSSGSA